MGGRVITCYCNNCSVHYHMIQLPVDHMISDYCSAQHYCIAGEFLK